MQTETELLKTAVPLLLEWYRVHKRDLPWRHGRTPYTALVAELMLQQTRVEAARERYVAFLNRFPTAEILASASEDEVLKEWEGLGYYSRARNLHESAKIIAREGFPQTWVGVRGLPGVGDYTAGAVSSIALGLPEPAVDGNVVRILTRLFADGETDGSALRKKYAEALRAVFPPETADFTEALMELGAIVCVPNGAPLCKGCPWETICRARLAGEQEKYPVRAEKKARRVEERVVYVLKCGREYALRKRGKGLLAGMWEFPNELVTEETRRAPGTFPEKRAKHIFTHVEWRMTGYLVEVKEKDPRFDWATAEEIEERYAIPSAFKPFLTWINRE